MTAPLQPSSQYSTAKLFTDRMQTDSANLAGSPDDLERIRSYVFYEDMYYNRPENFKVFIRGENNDPIYVPSAKKIIEAMNRFLCKGFTFQVTGEGSAAELKMRIGNLFKREKMNSKFANQKRFGLIRGDAMFFVTADPTKEQFSRLSIHELNPGNYFEIKDPLDRNHILGCHIVEVIRDPREDDDRTKTIVRRRTYLKGGVSYNSTTSQYEQAPSAPAGIWTEVTHWAVGKWDDRNMKSTDLERITEKVNDVAMFQLPARVTSLPVYHWQNVRMESGFGLSEIAGIETIIHAINQDVSDVQLTMVLQGLGVYVTDSKPPVDESGQVAEWEIGPGSVAEIAKGGMFNRVSGVGGVSEAIALIDELKKDAQEANGIPDIAAGKVDVAVAESGISLTLQMMPILASAEEKQLEILGTMDHLLYDLKTQWFPAYEGVTFDDGLEISTHVDDPMPVNRDSKIQEVMLLMTSSMITIAQAQAELAKLGYNFTGGEDTQVLKDAAALAAAQSGVDNRYAQDLEAKETELSPSAGVAPDFGGEAF